jgi:hypothetical protein
VAALLLISLAGCSRATPEAKVFRRFGLPSEVEVVATVQGRTGFNIWDLRMPAGFPITDRIRWPSGYKQDLNVIMDDGPDCASALIAVASNCRTRPLAVRVGPGGRNGGCTASLDLYLQPPMLFHQKPVDFAQFVIDC